MGNPSPVSPDVTCTWCHSCCDALCASARCEFIAENLLLKIKGPHFKNYILFFEFDNKTIYVSTGFLECEQNGVT